MLPIPKSEGGAVLRVGEGGNLISMYHTQTALLCLLHWRIQNNGKGYNCMCEKFDLGNKGWKNTANLYFMQSDTNILASNSKSQHVEGKPLQGTNGNLNTDFLNYFGLSSLRLKQCCFLQH